MFKSTAFVTLFLLSAVRGQSIDCAQRPPMHPTECCPGGFPKLITKDIALTCDLPPEMADSPSRNSPPRGPPISCDAVACVLKNINVLSGDKIDKSAMKSVLEGGYGAEWKPAIEAALNECLTIDTSSSPCPNDAIVKCMKMTVIKNCPTSVWLSNDECTAVKQFMAQCPMKGKP